MKIALIIAAALLFAVNLAGYLGGRFLYNLALNPKSNKTAVISAPHNAVNPAKSAETTISEISAWWSGIPRGEAYITSFDGLRLRAHTIEQKTEKNSWVIAVHGYSSNADTMAGPAKAFYEMGFNVLLPDCRGHGGSEGSYIGMGCHDRFDVIGWVNHLIDSRGEQIDIILYGVSMGGAIVMSVSGEPLPANVRAIVEDCGYSSTQSEFKYQLKALFGLPPFPVLNYADLITKSRAGWRFGEAAAIDQVKKSKTPILFIHGTGDTFVPCNMAGEVYDAAGCEKQLLLVKDAAHALSSLADPETYWSTVGDFVSRRLRG